MNRTAMARSSVLILGLATLCCVAMAGENVPYVWDLPPGFPQPRVPDDNPTTAEKVELGRHLFYDTRLSADGSYACATCHQQVRAFTDGRPRGVGVTGDVHHAGLGIPPRPEIFLVVKI